MKRMHFVCTVDGCGRPHSSKGLCGAHWQRLRKTGNISPEIPVSKVRLGSRNSNWKGGQTHDGQGRVYTHAPNHPAANAWGYVYRYRIVVERHLGRYLRSDEIVHHKDGDMTNDAVENLEVMNQSDHMKAHRDDLLIARGLTPCSKKVEEVTA